MQGLWSLQVHPYLNPTNDSGRYMVLGKSLAVTGQQRLINAPQNPPDTLYPPLYPLLLAFWLQATGGDIGGTVLWVKGTQILLLLGALPLLLWLLLKARLPEGAAAVALLTAALCPALALYANEIMSESLFLCLCLASVVLVEWDARLPATGEAARLPPPALRYLSLLCAIGAFLTRTVGITLLAAQVVWFWRRFGPQWGMLALVFSLVAVGGWQARNQRVLREAPSGFQAPTYLRQFLLEDPAGPNAGRLAPTVSGLLARVRAGVTAGVGNLAAAYLTDGGQTQGARALFAMASVPITLLTLAGGALAWRRGLRLSAGFGLLFWLVTALWPWRDPRFLVPLIPFLLLFLALGAEAVTEAIRRRAGVVPARLALGVAAALLLVCCVRAHSRIIRREGRPRLPGYTLGRASGEAGFLAACLWLRRNDWSRAVVMGRPAYLLHLYSEHPTVQIEPTANPRVLEAAMNQPGRVGYLVQDAWPWSRTNATLDPYLRAYGSLWTLAWEDRRGSGVRIWKRNGVVPVRDRRGTPMRVE